MLTALLTGCDEAQGRPFDAGDDRTLTLLSLEAETKEAANGRTVGYLVATFEVRGKGLHGNGRWLLTKAVESPAGNPCRPGHSRIF